MSIQQDCMIVNLQVGLWLGYKLDKGKSQQVTADAGASNDAARVNKHIIPKESLKAITAAASTVRNHFYDRTLPWKDNGDRLLTRKLYTTFMEAHAKLANDFMTEVDQFVYYGYPEARAKAEFRMGSLWREDDYPEVNVVRKKFYINLDIDAVTLPTMLKGVIEDPEALKAAQTTAETLMQERTKRAVGTLWSQLNDTLTHFANKMGSDEIFRNTTVKNLEDLAALLPDLNFTDDPDLAKITAEVQAKLVGYDPNLLRLDRTVRNEAATEAKRILDNMAGFMSAFSGDE